MFQVEVGGGGRVDPEAGLQKPGYLVRDFALTSTLGARVQLSDYRGRSNLILVFCGDGASELDFLQSAAERREEITEHDAIVIAVLQPSARDIHSIKNWENPSFPILTDDDGRIHRLFGAMDEQGEPSAVIYVTDRFGEIVSVNAVREGKKLPSVSEVLKTLEFINSQCPECEPPEWPR